MELGKAVERVRGGWWTWIRWLRIRVLVVLSIIEDGILFAGVECPGLKALVGRAVFGA